MRAFPIQCAVRRAFTLVEVVVALGLGVLLVVGVQGLIVQAYRTSRTLEDRAQAEAVTRLPLELLEQDLAGTMGGDLVLTNQSLTLRTANAMQSQRIATRHVVHVRYRAVQDPDGTWRLARQEWELDAPVPEAQSSGVVVAEGLAGVHFAAFDGRSWQGTWPPRVARRLLAVRGELTRENGAPEPRVFRMAPWRWRRHDE
jgi:type II secretory pathway component PulJ